LTVRLPRLEALEKPEYGEGLMVASEGAKRRSIDGVNSRHRR